MKNILKKGLQILTYYLLTVYCSQLLAGELRVVGVTSQEGGESFSLNILLKSSKSNSSDSDEDYYQPKPSTFDSIDLYNFVKIQPATKFSISSKQNGFMLVGDFKPETSYKVILKAGLTSREGDRLTADKESDIRTSSFAPRFSFKSKSRYMPGTLQGSLQYESRNVSKVEFEVRQVFSQNMHHWLSQNESANDRVSEVVKTIVVQIKSKKNRTVEGSFSLKDLETIGQGVFVVVAKPPTQKTEAESTPVLESVEGDDGGESEEQFEMTTRSEYDHATLIVTNLSVVSKMGDQQAKVWVLDTRTLKPISDAQVDLVAVSNRKMDGCKTSGANGECNLSWKKRETTQPFAMIVRSGKDLTYVRFEDITLPNDHIQAGGRAYSAVSGGFDAYIYPERDLYRPGETVRMAAMIRNAKFEAVAKLPVKWTITNPRGKVVRESVSDSSEMGIAQMEFSTTPASDTGKYLISVASGKSILHETSLLVEEFVPERIGLKVASAQEVNVSKSQVPFNISALYLFGPPVAKGSYKFACSMKPAFSQIPNRTGFFTGLYSKESKQAVTLDASEGQLNEKGIAQANCNLDTAVSSKMAEAYEIKAKVDVNEAGSGRATTKMGVAYVASTDTLIGLKLEGTKGRTINVRGGLFDFKGGLKFKKTSLNVKLFNIREHWYYSYNSYDSWNAEEIIDPTGVNKVIEVNNGTFDFSIDAPSEGWGRWLVRVTDTKTGYTADLDAGYIGWYYSNEGGNRNGLRAPEPGQLKIELSKSEISPGDSVQVMINAPFAGRVLFSFETDKILDSQWVKVDKPGPVKLSLKVPNVLPNVYLTALLLKDPVEAGGKRFLPARAWGAASIKVVPAANQMEVKVAMPTVSESRKTINVEISNNKKVSTEYSLAVVDEGILQMTEFKSPDPLKRFFEARSIGVNSAETLGWTMAYNGENGKNPGGDAAQVEQNKNMPVKLVSFWYPGVKSDSSGRAQIKLPLPSFQGKLRIMTVASGKYRMGSTSTDMIVRDPLVLQSTLPRFLTQGDKFIFPVSITNLSGKDQIVNVEIASSPHLSLPLKKQTQTISNGQSRTLNFEAEVKGVTGISLIKITATSKDGKLNSIESFDLPVKPSGVEQTIRLALDAKKPINLATQLPNNWRTDYARVDATISSMPYLNQLSQLSQLIHYPYGCIEQTTSATLPLLTMNELLDWIDAKNKGKRNIKDMVNRGIARVLSMQTASGGFAYWPGGGQADPWGSSYATYMLLEAKKLGYEVNESSLKNALDYLETFARNQTYSLSSINSQAGVEPFSLYVLAKGGRNVVQELRNTIRSGLSLAKNKGRWNGLYNENYFLLMATAKVLNDSNSLKQLNDETIFAAQYAGSSEDDTTYWSSTRTDGLRLAVLQDISPNNPAIEILSQRVAAALAKNNFYYSTQDISWSVLGLGKRLVGLKKINARDLEKVIFSLNGKHLTKNFEVSGAPGFSFEGPNLNTAKIDIAGLNSQQGVYLYLKATGFSKTVPASTGQLKIGRIFYKRDGTSLNTSSIKQGDTVYVGLSVHNTTNENINNVAIVDRLPSGFEIENPRLGKSEELDWMNDPFKAEYQDLRDDRVQVFGSLKSKETVNIYYSARAVTKGRFTAPPAFVEAMYDPASFGYDSEESIQIVDAGN